MIWLFGNGRLSRCSNKLVVLVIRKGSMAMLTVNVRFIDSNRGDIDAATYTTSSARRSRAVLAVIFMCDLAA